MSYELDGVGNRGYLSGGDDTGLYVQDPSAPDPLDFQMNQYTSTPLEIRGRLPRAFNVFLVRR